jgi:hypothetical protein
MSTYTRYTIYPKEWNLRRPEKTAGSSLKTVSGTAFFV